MSSTSYITKEHRPYILFLLLASLVLGTGLAPGHLFLLDMSWPEQFTLSNYTDTIQPSFPLIAVFAILGSIIPVWVLQKIVLLGILTGAGTTVFHLSNHIQKNARSGPPLYVQRATSTVAGSMAILNPFVAERLLAGQWLVLAGYAYTPLVILLFMRFLKFRGRKKLRNQYFWQFCIAYAMFPIISIHWWYIATPLLFMAFLLQRFHTKRSHKKQKKLTEYFKPFVLCLGVFVLVNAFWFTSITGNTGQLSSIGDRDFEVFQTVGDRQFGLEANVISLYGFWNDRMQLPKDFNQFWIVYGISTFALAVAGAVILTRRGSVVAAALLGLLPLTIVVALGYSHTIGREVIDILRLLPGFAGMRETAKIIGILALFVALFTPYAITSLYSWNARRSLFVSFIVTVIMMSGMLLGARGQITPYEYPASYRETDQILQEINQPALVLPWKGYLNVNYADNQFVANPANNYFSTETRTSRLTGNGLLDGAQEQFENAVIRPYSQTWVDSVVAEGYQHVIITKTDAWKNHQPLLDNHEVIFDSPEIALVKI